MPALVRINILTFILILAGAVVDILAAPARLSIYPRVSLDEGIRIEAFIPRDSVNRAMRLEVDGPAYYRSTEELLEGERARALFTLFIDRVPEGVYDVRLFVVKEGGKVETTRSTFCRGNCGAMEF